MVDQRPITWPELLDFQSRVVSRRQALGCGVSSKTVAGKAGAGAWQRLQRGRYGTFSGVPPRESRLWAAVERAHGLPRARRQARRDHSAGVRYLDNYYEGYRLCVELDGQSSHPPEQKWRDVERDNENFIRDDIHTLRFGLLDVTSRRCDRAADLGEVFLRRGWDGAGLKPCGPGCQVTRLVAPRRG